MPGFMPGIHDFRAERRGQVVVDGRDKPGHDGENADELE
jgi:hypothetical protein